MTIAIKITNIDGVMRTVDAAADSHIPVEPGDQIQLPDVSAGQMSFDVTGEDGLAVTVDGETLVLDEFYTLLDAELDVSVVFQDATVDSLGALLPYLADDSAGTDPIDADLSDVLIVMDGAVTDPTTLSLDEDSGAGESVNMPGLIDEQEVVFIDSDGQSDSEDSGPFHGGEALTLAELLDFPESGEDGALEILRPQEADEFEGFFAPVTLHGQTIMWSPLSQDGAFDLSFIEGDAADAVTGSDASATLAWSHAIAGVDGFDAGSGLEGGDSFWLV